MHLSRLWMVICLCAAGVAAAAVVYKWTDADGVVHYSDQAVPGAEKIVTSFGTDRSAPPTGSRGSPDSGPQPGPQPGRKASQGPAQAIAIESPTAEQVFFGDEIIPIRLHLDPPLITGQTISWQMNDGSLDQPPDATAFTLQSLSRGTYQLTATVTDATTGETRSSGSVTFYVRQPSELSPLHKKP